MTPDDYCGEKAAKRGSSLFYACLRLPPEKRRAVVAVHAFRQEMQEVAVECSEPALGLTKLQWWRQQVAAVYGGVPQHPVARALQPVVETFRLPAEPFQEIIQGVETDLIAPRYPDMGALAQYCDRVGSVPNRIAAEILGYQGARTAECVRDLGLAIRMCRIVRDVGLDAQRDRIYLPLDAMSRFSVEPSEVIHRRHSDRFQKLIEFQIEYIERCFANSLSAFPALDRVTQRPLLVLAAISRALLREIRADGCHVLERRTSLTPLRKLWISLRSPEAV